MIPVRRIGKKVYILKKKGWVLFKKFPSVKKAQRKYQKLKLKSIYANWWEAE